jgi:hypothetical protein
VNSLSVNRLSVNRLSVNCGGTKILYKIYEHNFFQSVCVIIDEPWRLGTVDIAFAQETGVPGSNPVRTLGLRFQCCVFLA